MRKSIVIRTLMIAAVIFLTVTIICVLENWQTVSAAIADMALQALGGMMPLIVLVALVAFFLRRRL